MVPRSQRSVLFFTSLVSRQPVSGPGGDGGGGGELALLVSWPAAAWLTGGWGSASRFPPGPRLYLL